MELLVHKIVMGITVAMLSVTQCHGQGLTPHSCRFEDAREGQTAECNVDEMVFSVCAAAENLNACGGHTTRIECCKVNQGPLSSSSCITIPEDSGDMATCPTSMFMRGACSSHFNPMCDEKSHSIKCCDYKLNNSPLYQVNPTVEGTSGNFVDCPDRKTAAAMCASVGRPACTDDSYTLLLCAYPDLFFIA
ncbi:unnamed protein product [Darwinula stevensoni]|uniref:Uncharacterized protein n=1 Tax=Darwinula stevensoni TaxID=69355 RepID=A0A7R9FQF9_9CRUS|nr:unnamed protein product [Darwinula stevensoni]CAG0899656.1 unnamed protein product [Darwinula stevensoni]